MRVWVTRPEPDASKTANALRVAGHEAWVLPLLDVRLAAVPSDLFAGVRAVLVTSRNAVRALDQHSLDERAKALPCFAVGEATAAALRGLGFTDVRVGSGTAAALPDIIAGQITVGGGPLLYLSGTVVAFDLEAALHGRGYAVRRHVAYAIEPAAATALLEPSTLKAAALDAVLLLSAETARAYLGLVEKRSLAPVTGGLVHLCLSKSVADVFQAAAPGIGTLDIRVARAPNLDGIFQIIAAWERIS